jgi:peptidyl-prolyl cis-trans isomerase C
MSLRIRWFLSAHVPLVCAGLACGLSPMRARAQAAPEPTPSPSTTAVTKPAPTGGLAELADQFDKTPDTIVADVNGTPITLGMVADRLREFPDKFSALPPPLVYKGALDDLIQQRALAVKAKELGLDKLPSTQRHIDEASDRELGQALLQKLVQEMVTDKGVETIYNSNVAGTAGPEEVKFRIIAAATESDANELLAALGKGADFAGLAQKYSKDSSGLTGGEIDYASRDKLIPEIAAVVFALQPGQTTAYPVRVRGLWLILQVEGRRQQGTPTLAMATPAIRAELTREASAVILQKARAAVVVHDYGPTGTSKQASSPTK